MMSKFSIRVLARAIATPVAAIAVLLVPPSIAQSVDQQRPNIILIVTDDQGYGDIGLNSNPAIETPNLNRLHDDSIRLTDFHVDPTCSPTRAALLTGQHSLRTKVWHTIFGRSLLPADKTTLAERLRDAGYSTAMFGKWHLGDNYPFRPQDQGFDLAIIHQGGGVGQTPDYWGNTQRDDTYFVNGQPQRYDGWSTDVWFDLATDFIEDQSEDPFFAYIATNAPHSPYRADAADVQRYLDKGMPQRTAKFYAMISGIDDRVGKLRQRLEDLGLAENTIFIFMTDNGSSLRPEEGLPELDGWDYNAGLRGFKSDVYDGGHRVPFYISWPAGKLGAPRDIDGLTAHFDVLPTLLDLADVPLEPEDIDGISFAPALQAASAIADRTLVVTNQRVDIPSAARPHAIMTSRWRLVHAREGTAPELFDMNTDPGQAVDVSSHYPDVVKRLGYAYKDWWSQVAPADAENERERIIIGHPAENPARLTAMDWMEGDKARDVPWFSGFQEPGQENVSQAWLGREHDYAPLPWYLQAHRSGTYRLSAWLHDKPAMTPIARKFAVFEVNNARHSVRIDGLAAWSELELPLDQGAHRVRMWFANDIKGETDILPAIFGYVEIVESGSK